MTIVRPRRRVRLRWTILVGLALIIFAHLSINAFLARQRVQRLIAEIHQFLGYLEVGDSTWVRLQKWFDGGQVQPTHLVLQGYNFRPGWVDKHDGLRDLRIEAISIRGTAIPEDDLVQLIELHPVKWFEARGQPIGEPTLTALAHQDGLLSLEVPGSDLTDELLGAIMLEDLMNLDVSNTKVTSDGLSRALARFPKLRSIAFDGPQLTDEVASQLALIGTVSYVELHGEQADDATFQRLQALKGLRFVHLVGTSVSDDAVKSVLPQSVVRRVTMDDVGNTTPVP